MKTIELQLPFSGFYESIHDMQIDSFLEMEIDNIEESKIKENYHDFIDYEPIRKAICKCYIEAYNKAFFDEWGIDLKLQFKELISPREYNFSTDKLFVMCDESIFNSITHMITKSSFKTKLLNKYSERSGFIPFQRTLDKIEEMDFIYFSEDVLNELLSENAVIDDHYYYSDNVFDAILNSINPECYKD